MTRLDHAQAVLDALGKPAERPTPAPLGVSQRLCRYGCGVQLVIAHLPGGQWCALQREPDGDLVIVNAMAITRGAHHADAPRYCFHRCQGRRA